MWWIYSLIIFFSNYIILQINNVYSQCFQGFELKDENERSNTILI